MTRDTTSHIVQYQANRDDTSCWAECSCGDKGPRHPGSITEYAQKMDAWADSHES